MEDDNKEAKTTQFIGHGSHKGKGLAVFTSGGDSQGMCPNSIILVPLLCKKSLEWEVEVWG